MHMPTWCAPHSHATYCNCNLTSFYHLFITLNERRTRMCYYPSLCSPQSCQLVCGAAMYCCCMYVVCNCWREEAVKRSLVHTSPHVHSYTNCCVVLTRIGFEYKSCHLTYQLKSLTQILMVKHCLTPRDALPLFDNPE